MAKKNNDAENMAHPQDQKADPVAPPEAKKVAPMSFFDDPRMARNSSGVRDFTPKRVTKGNEHAPSKERDD